MFNREILQQQLVNCQDSLGLTEQKLKELEDWHEAIFNHLGDEVHLWKVLHHTDGTIKTWELGDVNPSGLRA